LKLNAQVEITNSLELKIKCIEKENIMLRNELETQKSLLVATSGSNNNMKSGIFTEYTIPVENSFSALDVDTSTDFQIMATTSKSKIKTPTNKSSKNNVKKATFDYSLKPTEQTSIPTKRTLTHQYSAIPTTTQKNNNISPKNKKIKIFVIGDSHVKRLNKELFNYSLNEGVGNAFLKHFDSANTKRMHHHILPTLHEEKPDMVIIHCGTNDVNDKTIYTTPPIDIANRILEIGNTCKEFGVKNVAFSSILPRKDANIQRIINETNDHLQNVCAFNQFGFVSNGNINEDFLHSDGTHLNAIGSHLPAGNLTTFINSSF